MNARFQYYILLLINEISIIRKVTLQEFGTQSVFECNVKLIQLKGGDTLTIKLFFANQFKDISIEVLFMKVP